MKAARGPYLKSIDSAIALSEMRQRWETAQQFYHGEVAMPDSNYVYREPVSTSVRRLAPDGVPRVSQESHYTAETIRIENCGRADGEWVRRSDYEAISAELVKVRKELEVAGAVCRLSALPQADMVPAAQYEREVLALRGEIERYQRLFERACATQAMFDIDSMAEKLEKAERALTMAGIGAEQSYPAKASEVIRRQEVEIAALRSQLALAESKRKPARHRPGEQVSVGWDPEGD